MLVTLCELRVAVDSAETNANSVLGQYYCEMRAPKVCLLGACLCAMACGNPFGLEHMGPIVRVRAAQEKLGASAITLHVGDWTGLTLTVYDATDSLITPDVTWTTRNSQIASNFGSAVTAVAAARRTSWDPRRTTEIHSVTR
jgi:hypothetical protein